MDGQKLQVSERIKEANNILVTVSNNPSLDQLSACIGLTLALNKMGKHATAVFSGAVPSILEFLQPEKTIEKNTDSLRDFIIALDKSKADKLRYKVEDKVVKIFITPYKTSISERDLQFSQGDFNVDVVVGLGVHDQAELDQAITAHGRILHDATVMTVNIKPGGELGSINWLDAGASSLSELASQLVSTLDKKLIDNQIATAFLTGIVAETARFSNEKTSPQTMSVSAELMAAGANQQLVATKLEEPPAPPPAPPIATANANEPPPVARKSDDGTLEITHDEKNQPPEESEKNEASKPEEPTPEPPQIKIDEHGSLHPISSEEPAAESDKDKPKPIEEEKKPEPEKPAKEEKKDNDTEADVLPPKPKYKSRSHDNGPRLVLQPPTFDSQLTANATPADLGEAGMTLPRVEPEAPLLGREPLQPPSKAPPLMPPSEKPEKKDTEPEKEKPTPYLPPPLPPAAPEPQPPKPANETLSDLERSLNSSHTAPTSPPPAPPPISQASPSPTPPTPPEPTFTLPPPPPPPPPITPNHSEAPLPTPPTPDLGTLPDLNTDVDSKPAGSPMPSPSSQAGPAPSATAASSDLANARDAVAEAINADSSSNNGPIEALGAQPLGGPLHNAGVEPPANGADPLTALGISSDPNATPPTGAVNPAPPSAPPPAPPMPTEFPQPSFTPPPPPAPQTPQPPSPSPNQPNSPGMPPTPGFGPAGTPPPGPPPMLPPLQPPSQ